MTKLATFALGIITAVTVAGAGAQPYDLAFRPLHLDIDRGSNRIYAASFISPSSRLEIFDGATSRRTQVPVAGSLVGFAVEASRSRLYVTVAAPNQVKVLDAASGATLGVVPLPSYPYGVVTDAVAGKTYVLLEDNAVGVIDVGSLQLQTIPIGVRPGYVVLNPRTHRVYVLAADGTRMVVIDGANPLATILLGSASADTLGLAVNPVTNVVYALVDRGHKLLAIDGATNAVTAIALPGAAPGYLTHGRMAINTVTNRIYLTAFVTKGLTVIDGSSRVVSALPLPYSPSYAVAVDETTDRVFATYDGLLMVVEVATGNVTEVPTGTAPAAAFVNIAVDSMRGLVYVVNAASITVLDMRRANLATTLGMAVEYYDAVRDHYVIASEATEIRNLDLRSHWVRTGQTYGAFLVPEGRVPVCRFYVPPGRGDSHLMMANADECAATAARFPEFVYESADVFRVALPDFTSGICDDGLAPVYRLWNARPDSNHRYTTERSIRDAMLGIGYVAEGYGPDAVSMCVPSPPMWTLP